MYTTVGPRCGIADYTRDLTSALAADVEIMTIPIHPATINPLRTLLAAIRLSRRDVAHVQHTYSFFGIDQLTYTVLIRILFAGIRAPLILTAHTVRKPGPDRYDGGLGSGLANSIGAPAWHDTETFRRADAVIVHASFHRQRLTSRGVPAERIHVIPPGVPTRVPVEAGDVAAYRGQIGVSAEVPIIGLFGFLEESKRFTDVLEAAASLVCRPVVLVAGGPRLPEHAAVLKGLIATAKRLGVEDRLVVTGYLDPALVPIALEAMDLVAIPYGTDQSMSYSLHRALGQGRPVVAVDLPTFREIQGRCGCLSLVPKADPAALRETLAYLLGDRAARARLAAAACDYGERAGWSAAAAQTIQVYAAVRKACG